MQKEVNQKLLCLVEAFCPILYEDDEVFLENMKSRNLAGDDIRMDAGGWIVWALEVV